MRRRNEDAVFSGRSLFAVADGLGGHTSGDVASTTVIEALRPHDRQVDPADLPTVLGRAVYAANQALHRRIETEPERAGMGTTLVAMLWSGTTAVLANVGDSRAYLLRDTGRASAIIQITEDHTYGNLVADAGDVPNLAGRISRFLDGRADGRSPDLTVRALRAGDRFLLCSDGLSSAVPGELIRDTLRSSNDPEKAADRLVTLAIDHGGPDNITVIVIDVRNA
ncbi:protein phosphatase 2C domain-containing protein [Streptosporangium sp. NPDC002524]|uniref:PP2C family protein-serine/threonine phosphatase n=1 Tax=Streptosporangium sp. NPDC002524 TaxID=3154537 RepID=UPI00331935A3